jgi:hypothetical protein
MGIFSFLFDKSATEVPTNLKFIEAQNIVRAKLRQLKRTGEKTQSGNDLYVDPHTNQKWEKYRVELDEPLRIEGAGLRTFPVPNTEGIINIILTTRSTDELGAAAEYLYLQEIQGVEFRERLLDAIEKQLANIPIDWIDCVYKRANLADYGNKRQTANKSIEEIKTDYSYFKELTNRADKLRLKITTANTGLAPFGPP